MAGVGYLPGYMHMCNMCMHMCMYDHRCAGLLLTLYALRLLRTHPADTPSAAGTPAAAAAAAAAGPRREGWRHLVGLFAYRLLTPLALVPACFAVWVGANPGRKQGPPKVRPEWRRAGFTSTRGMPGAAAPRCGRPRPISLLGHTLAGCICPFLSQRREPRA